MRERRESVSRRAGMGCCSSKSSTAVEEIGPPEGDHGSPGGDRESGGRSTAGAPSTPPRKPKEAFGSSDSRPVPKARSFGLDDGVDEANASTRAKNAWGARGRDSAPLFGGGDGDGNALEEEDDDLEADARAGMKRVSGKGNDQRPATMPGYNADAEAAAAEEAAAEAKRRKKANKNRVTDLEDYDLESDVPLTLEQKLARKASKKDGDVGIVRAEVRAKIFGDFDDFGDDDERGGGAAGADGGLGIGFSAPPPVIQGASFKKRSGIAPVNAGASGGGFAGGGFGAAGFPGPSGPASPRSKNFLAPVVRRTAGNKAQASTAAAVDEPPPEQRRGLAADAFADDDEFEFSDAKLKDDSPSPSPRRAEDAATSPVDVAADEYDDDDFEVEEAVRAPEPKKPDEDDSFEFRSPRLDADVDADADAADDPPRVSVSTSSARVDDPVQTRLAAKYDDPGEEDDFDTPDDLSDTETPRASVAVSSAVSPSSPMVSVPGDGFSPAAPGSPPAAATDDVADEAIEAGGEGDQSVDYDDFGAPPDDDDSDDSVF